MLLSANSRNAAGISIFGTSKFGISNLGSSNADAAVLPAALALPLGDEVWVVSDMVLILLKGGTRFNRTVPPRRPVRTDLDVDLASRPTQCTHGEKPYDGQYVTLLMMQCNRNYCDAQ